MKQKKKKRKRKIFLPLFLIFFIIIGFYSHQSYETAMHEQLPDSLIEFEQKYPEATDFVENYHKLVDCLEKCLIYGHIRRFAN